MKRILKILGVLLGVIVLAIAGIAAWVSLSDMPDYPVQSLPVNFVRRQRFSGTGQKHGGKYLCVLPSRRRWQTEWSAFFHGKRRFWRNLDCQHHQPSQRWVWQVSGWRNCLFAATWRKTRREISWPFHDVSQPFG